MIKISENQKTISIEIKIFLRNFFLKIKHIRFFLKLFLLIYFIYFTNYSVILQENKVFNKKMSFYDKNIKNIFFYPKN